MNALTTLAAMPTGIFAQAAGEITSNTFWTSGGGMILRALLGAAGAVLAVLGVLRGLAMLRAKGDVAGGVRVLFTTIVLCAFLFRPMLINDLLGLGGKLMESVLRGGAEVVDKSGGSVPPP